MSTVTDADIVYSVIRDNTDREEASRLINAIRGALEAAAAMRPVPQAGEVVAEIVDGLRALLQHPIADPAALIIRRAADLLTAQDAEIERLNKSLDVASDCATDKNRHLAAKDAEISAQRDNIRMLEGALIDKNVAISSLNSDIHHLIADPAAELGCQADNESVLVAISALKARQEELEAALNKARCPHPGIDRYSYDGQTVYHCMSHNNCDCDCRAALAPAGTEVKP